jgi:hypothetical protein
MKYQGKFNFSGQVITLYTDAKSKSRAYYNFITRLSKMVNYSTQFLKSYFVFYKNNYNIMEVK